VHLGLHDAKAALDGGQGGGPGHLVAVYRAGPVQPAVQLQQPADARYGAPEEDEDEDEDEDKGRPQALAQVKGRPLSGKAAVRAAAAHPGGLLHGDDAYVRVGTGQVLTPQQRAKAARGDELREAQQLRALAAARGRVRSPPVHYKGNDAEVPVTQIKAETYPLMNLASQDSNGVPSPPTANKLLAKAIRESGAGNGNYIDTTEGTVTGPAPITQVGVCLPCLLFLPRL